MRKIATVSLLSNIALFGENLKVGETMPWMIPWLIGSLLVVGLFFWAMYKAIKTKNAKYGYVIGLSVILMVVLLFI